METQRINWLSRCLSSGTTADNRKQEKNSTRWKKEITTNET
jgi:hypothetical protein